MVRNIILLFAIVSSVMLSTPICDDDDMECNDLGIKGDNRCTFYPGDGVGGTEFYVGMLTDSQCIDACLAKKKTDDSINGVTILSNNEPGCWCERSMRGRNDISIYKSCFIRDTERQNPCDNKPCGPYGNCTVVVANGRMYGYECKCQHGYSGDGKHCRDISNVSRGYTIDCYETYVVAIWSRASFDNANQIQITLNLPSCNEHQENSTHVWIMTNFTQCGSEIVEAGDVMLQKNTAKITTTHNRNNLTIQQRMYSYKMECSFQRNRSVSTNLAYNVSDVVDNLVKKSRQTTFDVSMSFYHTSSFLQIISSPLTVTSFQPIYVGLTQSNNNFKIIVHQCFATPSASTDDISDVLFHKKCPLDPTFRIIDHSNTKFLFTINAFKFIEVNGGVYMHCRFHICKANSSTEDCRQACSLRKRRGIQDEHDNQVNVLKESVVTSPKISFKTKAHKITSYKVPTDTFDIIANNKPIEKQEVIGINHKTLVISTVIPVALVIIAFISVIKVKTIISHKQTTKSRLLALNNPTYEKLPMDINE